jgi:hypothetical protein
MTRRTSRSDALIDRPALLTALGACRGAVIAEMAKCNPPAHFTIPDQL